MRAAAILVLLLGAVWFAITNVAVVTVNVFLWRIDTSLALLIGVVFVSGFFLGLLWLTPGFLRHRSHAHRGETALSAMTKERDELTEKSDVLTDQVHQLAPLSENKSEGRSL